MIFNFFKKKKEIDLVIKCDTDIIVINEKEINFPTNYDTLIAVLGEPDREIHKTNHYMFWDKQGIFCGYTNKNNILSINAYQNKQNKSEYNTQHQFKGKLLLNNEDITNNEFGKIPLGKIAIHRLGKENEVRVGFNLGINKN
ncbi:hypothetical protein [Tenacibaculum aestuariivivum]|uniref:DUF7738 domain-containing protein n=1 Tax=Tenacibaculum aestuariivivum TaxID=2006131 RepID=UPI003AB72481